MFVNRTAVHSCSGVALFLFLAIMFLFPVVLFPLPPVPPGIRPLEVGVRKKAPLYGERGGGFFESMGGSFFVAP